MMRPERGAGGVCSKVLAKSPVPCRPSRSWLLNLSSCWHQSKLKYIGPSLRPPHTPRRPCALSPLHTVGVCHARDMARSQVTQINLNQSVTPVMTRAPLTEQNTFPPCFCSRVSSCAMAVEPERATPNGSLSVPVETPFFMSRPWTLQEEEEEEGKG